VEVADVVDSDAAAETGEYRGGYRQMGRPSLTPRGTTNPEVLLIFVKATLPSTHCGLEFWQKCFENQHRLIFYSLLQSTS